jgi:F-type H+-transporting ATPase subunit a
MSIAWTQAAKGLLAVAADPLAHVSQHGLYTIEADLGPLTPNGEITVLSDLIVMMIVASVLLMLFVPLGIRRRKGDDEVTSRVPRGPATALETICWGLREMVARPLLGPHTDRFIPFIWTVFFFVLTVNLLGLLPLGSLSSLFGTHVGGTATANLWTTGALALTTLVMMVINGLRLGGKDYLAHFNPVPKDMHWAMRLPLSVLMVVVEIFGTLAKIAALAIRLFANMTAGHILLAVLVGFVLSAGAVSLLGGLGLAVLVVPASAAITMLEIFVAFLQAFIFTFLSALFLGQSVLLHHDDHAEAH